MKIMLLAVLVGLSVGCAGTKALVTESQISFNPQTGLATLKLPKDSSWSWLDFQQTILTTNNFTNRISLVISNGMFRNNPMVLDAQANRDIQMINAMGTAFQNGIQAGAAGAGKAVVP